MRFSACWLQHWRPNFVSPTNFRDILEVCQRCLHMFCQPRKSIRSGSSWKTSDILWEYGVGLHLLLAVKSLCFCSTVCVCFNNTSTKPFAVLNSGKCMCYHHSSPYSMWIGSTRKRAFNIRLIGFMLLATRPSGNENQHCTKVTRFFVSQKPQLCKRCMLQAAMHCHPVRLDNHLSNTFIISTTHLSPQQHTCYFCNRPLLDLLLWVHERFSNC